VTPSPTNTVIAISRNPILGIPNPPPFLKIAKSALPSPEKAKESEKEQESDKKAKKQIEVF
jgi:hypothetical protein